MSEIEPENLKMRTNRPASHAPGNGSFTQELIEGVRAWARHTFSGASLLSGFKSLLWVAPLSAIIWVYAEQNDAVTPTEHVVVSVESADPSRVVHLLEPIDGKVSFVIAGTNTNCTKVSDILNSMPALPLELPESILATPGEHEVSGAMINDLELFRTNGVAVSVVNPQTLRVVVEMVHGVDVEVQPAPDGMNFSAPPVFTPRTVHVTAPDSVIDAAKKSNELVAYAHLDQTSEPLSPGPHEVKTVPLSLPFGDKSVMPVPSTVAAQYDIKKSDVSYVLQSVPVRVTYPPGFDDKFKAVYDTVVTNVTVTGPEEQIRALREDPNFQPQPWAWFEINPSTDKQPDTTYPRHLHFELPTGIHLGDQDQNRMISFKLMERRAAD
jgi:hypothetical protein